MTDTDDTLQAVHDYVKVNDINALYVDMTEQMLMYKPENPIRFIVDYLSYKYPKQVTSGRYVRNVDEAKGEDGVSWDWADTEPERTTKGGLDLDSDSEDDDDDYVDELPTFKPKKQRAAISATVNKLADDFTPQTVEKSNEARERILAILTTNKFFSKLDSEQREMMADAMGPVEKADGDVIMTCVSRALSDKLILDI